MSHALSNDNKIANMPSVTIFSNKKIHDNDN
jgi:hypothetical protein